MTVVLMENFTVPKTSKTKKMVENIKALIAMNRNLKTIKVQTFTTTNNNKIIKNIKMENLTVPINRRTIISSKVTPLKMMMVVENFTVPKIVIIVKKKVMLTNNLTTTLHRRKNKKKTTVRNKRISKVKREQILVMAIMKIMEIQIKMKNLTTTMSMVFMIITTMKR